MMLLLLARQDHYDVGFFQSLRRNTTTKDFTMQRANEDTLSRKEIRSILIETHREDQILWSTWLHRSSAPGEKSGLYRYREGFDAAILMLAQRFRVTLRSTEKAPSAKGKEKRGNIISLEQISIHPDDKGIYCLHCKEPLFRKGKRFWHCPACDIEFRVAEETE